MIKTSNTYNFSLPIQKCKNYNDPFSINRDIKKSEKRDDVTDFDRKKIFSNKKDIAVC